jgi:biofilm PGA synthesis N-glycosyltransferase PgaC
MEFAGLMGITAGSDARGHPLMCNGANLAVERSAFLEAGGYRSNEKIASGDDLFLMMRIREYFGKDAVKFNFSKEALVTTEPENRPAGFLKQRMRWSSKNRYLPDRFVLFVAVITWLMNLFLLSGIVAAFWSLPVLAAVLAVFIVKFFSEYHVVSHIIRLTGKKGRPFLFLIAQLINIPYVILVGLLGTFFSYEWKGRKVTPPVSPVR